MNSDPVDLALRHISETRHLLDALITSSESFDYRQAKLALKALDKKSRELSKVSAKLARESARRAENIIPLPGCPAEARARL